MNSKILKISIFNFNNKKKKNCEFWFYEEHTGASHHQIKTLRLRDMFFFVLFCLFFSFQERSQREANCKYLQVFISVKIIKYHSSISPLTDSST